MGITIVTQGGVKLLLGYNSTHLIHIYLHHAGYYNGGNLGRDVFNTLIMENILYITKIFYNYT